MEMEEVMEDPDHRTETREVMEDRRGRLTETREVMEDPDHRTETREVMEERRGRLTETREVMEDRRGRLMEMKEVMEDPDRHMEMRVAMEDQVTDLATAGVPVTAQVEVTGRATRVDGDPAVDSAPGLQTLDLLVDLEANPLGAEATESGPKIG